MRPGRHACCVRERACARACASTATPASRSAAGVASAPSTARRSRMRRPRDTSGASACSSRARSARRARGLRVRRACCQSSSTGSPARTSTLPACRSPCAKPCAWISRTAPPRRASEGAALGEGPAERRRERHAVDPREDQQPISVVPRAERERLGHAGAAVAQAREMPPLARCRRTADALLHALAQDVPAGPDTKLLQQDAAPVREAHAREHAARVVSQRLDAAGRERLLDRPAECRIAMGPADRAHQRRIRA